ncbi:hypothetical protein ACFX13_022998 [Malus domestica]
MYYSFTRVGNRWMIEQYTSRAFSFTENLRQIARDFFAKLSVHVTGDDAAEKDWRLFDIWDWRFDKLPVISAKLSLRVTGANASGKARCFSDF